MANYCASARSNYFDVRDEQAFLDWAKKRNLATCKSSKSGKFAIFAQEDDGWPTWDAEIEDEQGNSIEIDIVAELSEHLQEGQVAVLEQIGYEKLRYLTGSAVAVDHTGKAVTVDIDEIYVRAATAFHVDRNTIEPCHY